MTQINLPDWKEINSFRGSAFNGRMPEVEEALKKYGPVIATMESGGGYNSFAMAACNAQIDAMRVMLAAGVDVDTRDDRQYTALLAVVHWGFIENNGICKSASFLLENGANINARNQWGKTALIMAAGQGLNHVVELLLEKGADVMLRDDTGSTALDCAKTPQTRAVIEKHLAGIDGRKQHAVEAKTEVQVDALKHRHSPKISFGGKR